MTKARRYFSQQKYNLAAKYFKRHLKRYRNDYNAKTELGSSYYHMGRLKLAIKTLKRAMGRTSRRAQAYYYLGLSYSALKKNKKARYYFSLASAYTDPFATLAGFEMAVYWFNKKRELKASKWLEYYLQRDPSGIHNAQARNMLDHYRGKKKFFLAKGAPRPDPQAAVFKYDRWSLFEKPHYYYVNVGHLFSQFDGFSSKQIGAFVPSGQTKFGLQLETGIGFGPIKTDNAEGIIGYSYEQVHETNIDRLESYFDDPLDFNFFPYRFDLLQRRHRFIADFNIRFKNSIFINLYGELGFVRIGSSLTDYINTSIEGSVASVANFSTLRPEFGLQINRSFSTKFHLYVKKQVSDEDPDTSYQTYNFTDDFIQFVDKFSFGADLSYSLPKYSFNFDLSFFRYSYTYNDIWQDRTKIGFQAHVDHEIIPDLNLGLWFGYYQDFYRVELISQNGCSFIEFAEGDEVNRSSSEDPQLCERADSGFFVGAEAFYNFTKRSRVTLRLGTTNNSNDQLKIFDKQKLHIEVKMGWAFPTHNPIKKLTDKFSNELHIREDF